MYEMYTLQKIIFCANAKFYVAPMYKQNLNAKILLTVQIFTLVQVLANHFNKSEVDQPHLHIYDQMQRHNNTNI